ncbi:MAG TPA: helix-turn-helix domain-containing protein [Jatrophihabitans sp.]|nr:helix-turn-helix domain-containing protein [Jatrophihabitans sp.]
MQTRQLAEIEWPRLPPRWQQVLIPAEVPGLAREIVAVIRQQIPEYRRSLDGPYGRAIRRGVEEALASFVGQLGRHGGPAPAHLEVFRSLGRNEALEGRSHDCLQQAYRIGSRLAWRRIMRLNEVDPLLPGTVAKLAAAMHAYVDNLAAISASGFAEAALRGDELDAHRRVRLVQLLLDQPASPGAAIAELAGQLGWQLPAEVVLVDVADSADLDDRQLAELARTALGPAALGGRVSAGSVLLAPGPLTAGQRAGIAAAAVKAPLSVGCSVPLAQAPTSLRWAQLASRLVAARTLVESGPVFCDEHLTELLLQSERPLHEQLVRRRLAPLCALSPAKRVKYGRLLSSWLELGCSQGELAGLLGLHRQTVHYQFTRLADLFGEQLHDRTARVELLLALRAALPDWQADLPAPS